MVHLQFQRYENCECAKYLVKSQPFQHSLDAVEGRCNEETPECTRQFTLYVVTLTLMYCLAFLLQVAHILLPMRCVERRDKTFALAVFEGVCCLFGKCRLGYELYVEHYLQYLLGLQSYHTNQLITSL